MVSICYQNFSIIPLKPKHKKSFSFYVKYSKYKWPSVSNYKELIWKISKNPARNTNEGEFYKLISLQWNLNQHSLIKAFQMWGFVFFNWLIVHILVLNWQNSETKQELEDICDRPPAILLTLTNDTMRRGRMECVLAICPFVLLSLWSIWTRITMKRGNAAMVGGHEYHTLHILTKQLNTNRNNKDRCVTLTLSPEAVWPWDRPKPFRCCCQTLFHWTQRWHSCQKTPPSYCSVIVQIHFDVSEQRYTPQNLQRFTPAMQCGTMLTEMATTSGMKVSTLLSVIWPATTISEPL